MESHLDGVEISCEAFIHNRKLKFLNITEYVVFGHSMMAPPSPEIEELRPRVRETVEQLIDTFDIECGLIHPEFFLNEKNELSFVEVAYRIPGGHIFNLIQRVYDFCPFQARSEEHTSELQSRGHLVCRLLLEKKKNETNSIQ